MERGGGGREEEEGKWGEGGGGKWGEGGGGKWGERRRGESRDTCPIFLQCSSSEEAGVC